MVFTIVPAAKFFRWSDNRFGAVLQNMWSLRVLPLLTLQSTHILGAVCESFISDMFS